MLFNHLADFTVDDVSTQEPVVNTPTPAPLPAVDFPTIFELDILIHTLLAQQIPPLMLQQQSIQWRVEDQAVLTQVMQPQVRPRCPADPLGLVDQLAVELF
jgi:hypothetical protein